MSHKLKWGVKQRLIQIEMCLYWKNQLTTNMLIDTFDIHRRQAGIDIAKYQDIAPDNITYNPSKRCYEPTANFKPLFIQKTSAEYIKWIQSQLISPTDELPLAFRHIQGMPFELPVAQIKHSVLKSITYVISHNKIRPGDPKHSSQALKKKKILQAHYVDESLSETIIAPHALCKIGNFWFIRGMEFPSSEFILLDLNAIHETQVIDLIKFLPDNQLKKFSNLVKPKADKLWNEPCKLIIGLNPALNLSERMTQHFKECYQLTKGTIIINTRTALLKPYISMLNGIKHSSDLPLFVYTIKHRN